MGAARTFQSDATVSRMLAVTREVDPDGRYLAATAVDNGGDDMARRVFIDSIRLVKKGVEKAVYKHSDKEELETLLVRHADKSCRWVVTDGVFSMEGDVAKLVELVELCRRHQAMLVVDDSHGVGVLGKTGRGTAEHCGLFGQVDIVTGTLGKALGGAAGGYIAA